MSFLFFPFYLILFLFLISKTSQNLSTILNQNTINKLSHPSPGIYFLQFNGLKPNIFISMKSTLGNPSLYAYLCDNFTSFNLNEYLLTDYIYKGYLIHPSKINNYFTTWITLPKPNDVKSEDQYILIVQCKSHCSYEIFLFENNYPRFSTSRISLEPNMEYTLFSVDSDRLGLILSTPSDFQIGNQILNVEIVSYTGVLIFNIDKTSNVFGSPDYSINKQIFRLDGTKSSYSLVKHTKSSENYIHVKYWISNINDYLYSYTHELGKTQSTEVFLKNSTYITFPIANYETLANDIIYVFIYTDQCYMNVNDGNGNNKEGYFFYYEYNLSLSTSNIKYTVDLIGSKDFNESFVPSQEDINNGYTEYCNFFISSTDNSDNYKIILGDGIPTQFELIPNKLDTIKCIYPYLYADGEDIGIVFNINIPMFSKIKVTIQVGRQNRYNAFVYTVTETKDIMLGHIGKQYCKDDDLCPVHIEIHNLLNSNTHIIITPRIGHIPLEYIPKNTYKFISLYKEITPTFYFRVNNYEKGKIIMYYEQGIIEPRYDIFTYSTYSNKTLQHRLDTKSTSIDSYYNVINYSINQTTCNFGCFGHLHFNDETIVSYNGAIPIKVGFIIQRSNEHINADINRTIPGALEYDDNYIVSYNFSFISNVASLIITLEGKYSEFQIKDLNEQPIFTNINNDNISTWNVDNNIVILHYNEKNSNYNKENVNLEINVRKTNISIREEEFNLNKEFRIKVEPIFKGDDIIYNINSNKMEICKSVNGICYYIFEMNPIEKENNAHYETFLKSQIRLDDITIQYIIIEQTSFTKEINTYFIDNNKVHTYHNENDTEFTFIMQNELYLNIEKPLFLFKIISSQNEQYMHFGITPQVKDYYKTNFYSHHHLIYSTFDNEDGFDIFITYNDKYTFFNTNDKLILYINAFRGNAIVSIALYDDPSYNRKYQINAYDGIKIILNVEKYVISIIPLSNENGVAFEYFFSGKNLKNIFNDFTSNYKTINYMFFNSLEHNIKFNLVYDLKNFLKDMKYNIKLRSDFYFMHNNDMFQNGTCFVKGQFINTDQLYQMKIGNDIEIEGDKEMIVISYETYGTHIIDTKGKGNDNNYFYIGIECNAKDNNFNMSMFNIQILPLSNNLENIIPIPQQKYLYSYLKSNTQETFYLSTSQGHNDIGSFFIIEYSSCSEDNLSYEITSINNEYIGIEVSESKKQYGKQIIHFKINENIQYIKLTITHKASSINKKENTYYILKYKSKGYSNLYSISPFLNENNFVFAKQFSSNFKEEHIDITTLSKQSGILSEWGYLLNNSTLSIMHTNYIFNIYPPNSINNQFICSSHAPLYEESIVDENTFSLFWKHSHKKFKYIISLLAFFTMEGGEEFLMSEGILEVENVPSKLIIYLLCGFGGILLVIFGIFLWLLKQIRMIEKHNEEYVVDENEEEFDEDDEMEVAFDFDEMKSGMNENI